ncbi:hypothetical protein P153DRAFT_418327 [Dothidotthia symphoricarpi CBS 119687]|uniref:Uncharacterized protein n=1 Tax=Dothidotthia symphoricarpi CBS 119687 TaxID=1392245 RepID=A0A6A6AFW2_9PLEO|nr:uncharacterized protein P153DRAFT_418327 [Dothidotthia symphoricarpi CBS 119687]KAF2130670.1 hypothetical protein P153DRAFT_418327 [Dothidotthia symphoricarpi CBS 119687]
MAYSNPTLSLRLSQGSYWDNDIFQLQRQTFSGRNFVFITTFETERTVTLVCNGLVPDGTQKRLDILEALKSGLLELVESGKEEMIVIHCTGPQVLDHIEVSPKPSPRSAQTRRGLITNTTNELWKTILEPGKQYELRFSKSKGEVWGYYSDEGLLEEITPSQKLPIHREDSTIRFTVHNNPPPPRIFAKLKLTPECHLSGDPPFKIIIEFSTDSKAPITFCKGRPLWSMQWLDLNSVEQLMSCKDSETGESVEMPYTFGCFDSDPHPSFPVDDDFVEILSGRPWQFVYTLQNESSGGLGGLECLRPGKRYEAQVSTDLKGFGMWKFGLRKDLLDGSLEEKEKRWEMDMLTGWLVIETPGEPVVFKAVDGELVIARLEQRFYFTIPGFNCRIRISLVSAAVSPPLSCSAVG